MTRAEVEEVLKDFNQPYVTDATNLCNDYTRNSLRNVVIPYMTEKVNAHTVENIAYAAEELQKNFDFIEAEACICGRYGGFKALWGGVCRTS